MATIAEFNFNPFQENTYVVWDDTRECIIIDPGCYEPEEQETLFDYIQRNELQPVKLLLTHAHIDHVLGNAFVFDTFGLQPELHQNEVQLLELAPDFGSAYGIMMAPSPKPTRFWNEGDEVTFGETRLKVLFTPGHSPGSLSFYNEEDKTLISGDVLFQRSIGRTDLPGGNLDILMESIQDKLLVLDNDVEVYSGHGPITTIGEERLHNPFILQRLGMN